MRFRQALVQFDGALESLPCLAAPSKLVQDVAEIVVESRVYRCRGERTTVGGERFLMPSHAAQRAALTVERRDPIGTMRKRALEGIQSTLPVSLPYQSVPQIERRLGIAGRGSEDSTEALLRLFRPVETKQHHALIKCRVRRSRLEPGRLVVGSQRRLEIRGLLQHQSEMQMTGRGLGGRRDRTTKERNRLHRITALAAEQT